MELGTFSEQPSLTKAIRFLGSHSYTLSDDGRIVLPQEFREQLKDFPPYCLCAGLYEKCLWLVPQRIFIPMLDKISKAIYITDRQGQEFLRILTSYATDISHLGNLGRLVIPPKLRKWAVLEEPKTPVEIIGMVDRIEIWNQKIRSEREIGLDMEKLSQQVFETYRI